MSTSTTDRSAGVGRRRVRPVHKAATGLVVVLILVLGVLHAPHRPSRPVSVVGDTELMSAAVQESLTGQLGKVSMLSIEDEDLRFAHMDAEESTQYEIGSITKTFTALLFADAIARGEVEAGTTLGQVFSIPGSPMEDVRLDELASHRSGLPRLPTTIRSLARGMATSFTHGDPYTDDVQAVLDTASQQSLADRSTVQYSNLGMAVLGLAIAERSKMTYSDLVRVRITEPLGMKNTFVPASKDDPRILEADGPAITGLTENGLDAAPWTMGGYAAAGAIRSTPHDMALYAGALLEGSAPGSAALVPRFDASPEGMERIGYAWFTEQLEGREITWHNGGTGGYSSFLALDMQRKTAIVILGGTAGGVDDAALVALGEQARR
ncbi:MAG: serine hydrolase domain-containing protein [Arachnia sp.]